MAISASDGRADVLARQVEMYGEPLAERFARLLAAYRIPQSRLAATIGLSAPMLSQLATAQRVKISNPAVYARLLRLEELAGSPQVRSGEPSVLHAALDEVAASQPSLSTSSSLDARAVIEHLAAVAGADELARAAAAVPGTRLGELLTGAAGHHGAAQA